MPISTGQTIGHLAASFAGAMIVFLVQFGVPISPEQQAAILSVIMTGWAFGSTIYAFWHRKQVVTAGEQSSGSGGNEPQ